MRVIIEKNNNSMSKYCIEYEGELDIWYVRFHPLGKIYNYHPSFDCNIFFFFNKTYCQNRQKTIYFII